MKKEKRNKLERAGFKVSSVQQFLGLSDEETALIDLKVRLVTKLRAARQSSRIRQQDLATLIASSQSRIAKMEAGAEDVSVDLICRALFALGVSRREIGLAISGGLAA